MCGAASLCSPDNGKAVDGEFLARSLTGGGLGGGGSGGTVCGSRQNFKEMREEYETRRRIPGSVTY